MTQTIFPQNLPKEKLLHNIGLEFENCLESFDSNSCDLNYITLEEGGRISWSFEIPEKGWYSLFFRYRAPGEKKVATLITDDFSQSIGFGNSKVWNTFFTNSFLRSGIVTISLKDEWDPIDIDDLTLMKTSLSPTVKPSMNNFYKNTPEDLFLKINSYGMRIDSIKLSDIKLVYHTSIFPFQESALLISLDHENFSDITPDSYNINIYFNSGEVEVFQLHVFEEPQKSDLQIIAPFVDHGASVVIKLPNNEIMLVDCGKAWVRDSIIIPLLKKENISMIDHFILTHYHEDHDSGDKGEKIKSLFSVRNFYDYKSFSTGDEFSIGNVNFKILNSWADGEEENTRSLSFRMEYNGFVYVHGGDTYGINQEKIMKRFPAEVEADVFHANHHFHGSVNVDYLRAMNPKIILVQAQQAIYARSAYMEDFKKNTEIFLKENNRKYSEDLPSIEVGTVILRINNKNDWTYETRMSK